MVSLLAVIGAVAVPRRWLLWAGTFLVAMLAAVALTKPVVREVYFVFPPVYVLAACGAEAVGARLARLGGSALGTAWRPRLHRLVLAGIVLAVVVVTNADLGGDYYLPARWYQCRVTFC